MEKPKRTAVKRLPVHGMTADVLIALCPALILAVVTFGWRVLTITAVSVAACVGFEWLWTRLRRRACTLSDLSAVVTGLLLAFMLPVSAPVWLPVAGAAFAIIVVKQLFGGRGRNLFHPALGGYVFLLLSWPELMTAFTGPRTALPLFDSVEALAQKTPLMLITERSAVPNGAVQLLGQHPGALGETVTAALLLGGAYLLWRRALKYRIAAAYIATVAVLALLFPAGEAGTSLITHLCGGSLLLGAVFMATDSTTSPVAPVAQWVYGVGCGLLTMVIRARGVYPDGVAFAILLMNALTWILDRYLNPKASLHPRILRRQLIGLLGEEPDEPVLTVFAPETPAQTASQVDVALPEEPGTPAGPETPQEPEEPVEIVVAPAPPEAVVMQTPPAAEPEVAEELSGSLAELARKLGISVPEAEQSGEAADEAGPAEDTDAPDAVQIDAEVTQTLLTGDADVITETMELPEGADIPDGADAGQEG